jgi:hypothetical protein
MISAIWRALLIYLLLRRLKSALKMMIIVDILTIYPHLGATKGHIQKSIICVKVMCSYGYFTSLSTTFHLYLQLRFSE